MEGALVEDAYHMALRERQTIRRAEEKVARAQQAVQQHVPKGLRTQDPEVLAEKLRQEYAALLLDQDVVQALRTLLTGKDQRVAIEGYKTLLTLLLPPVQRDGGTAPRLKLIFKRPVTIAGKST